MSRTNNSKRVINKSKLFKGICIALLPTAFSFVLVSNILNQLKTEFILTNAQVGYIGGAALWGMAVSLLTLGPLLEKFGLKKATMGAFIGHLAGVTLFLAAAMFTGHPYAFWILFLGAIGFGAGNGMIEVAGNPMVTSLYPNDKVTKLNHFHAFFPGGMVFGGLLGWIMTEMGTLATLNIGHWTWQIAIIYIPVAIYGYMLFTEQFPKTEAAEAGVPFKKMVRYTFTNPWLWGLIGIMMITLSLEMGPSRWIPEVLKSAGVHGMLVFVWISGLMMILRIFSAPFVKRFSPTGMLIGASILTSTGLLMFAFFETGLIPLMIAATVFACGVAFYFPTMVGLMSERFPKAGSLGIVLIIGMGFFAAGGANAIMGEIADKYLPDALPVNKTIDVLETVEERYPTYVSKAENASGDVTKLAKLGYRLIDVENVLNKANIALEFYNNNDRLSGERTANALRALIDTNIEQEQQLIKTASSILRPADNYGGRMAFLWVGPCGFFVALVFVVVHIKDLKKGGYKAEKITE